MSHTPFTTGISVRVSECNTRYVPSSGAQDTLRNSPSASVTLLCSVPLNRKSIRVWTVSDVPGYPAHRASSKPGRPLSCAFLHLVARQNPGSSASPSQHHGGPHCNRLTPVFACSPYSVRHLPSLSAVMDRGLSNPGVCHGPLRRRKDACSPGSLGPSWRKRG